jgi:hypothetical protein
MFYEYFHSGIGVGHQTGWTGGMAALIAIFGKLDAQSVLPEGQVAVFGREIETA